MRAQDSDVAVIGGGLAGASAALAFAQQGCSVRLFERRDLARDPNRGDILRPQTIEIVRRLGLIDPLFARGATTLRSMETVDPSGEIAFRMAVDDYIVLNHAEMEATFLEAAESHGATIQPDVARALVRDGDAPDAGWLIETDSGTTRARFVVGADGADSLTRRTLGIELSDFHEYDNWIVVLHATAPSWLEPEHGWQLLHPEGPVFMLPTTPVGRVRLVVLIHRDDAKDWMTASEADLARRLGQRHPLLRDLDLTKRGGSHVYRIKRRHAETYSGPHAALVGDAAHTVHSMGGQGLNIAIQDSARLADLVGPVLRDSRAGDDALTRALAEYEAIRRPINTIAIEEADRASRLALPGEESFAASLGFFRKVAADPNYLREHGPRYGGSE
jgi:2-polyprenyl-6-methoxyphenol hydroxylase-like FAD-dependent oxidoreductase